MRGAIDSAVSGEDSVVIAPSAAPPPPPAVGSSAVTTAMSMLDGTNTSASAAELAMLKEKLGSLGEVLSEHAALSAEAEYA